MTKPIQKAEISSLVKGFITEASPLNFPSDASRDEENFILNKDGTRDRRLGIDFETSYSIKDTGYTAAVLKDAAFSQFRWRSAGNDPNNDFIVVQFGNRIDIYDSSKPSLSGRGFKGSVTFAGVSTEVRFSFAGVDGSLVVATATDKIYIVKYNGTSFTQENDYLKVRDLFGLPGLTGNDLNTRPSSLTEAHKYNLYNQGWGVPRKGSGGTLTDPVSIFYGHKSVYPSNSETVYVGLEYQAVSGGSPFERIYPEMYDDVLGLDVQAARGYFIIDALKRGTSRIAAAAANKAKFPQLAYTVGTLPADTTPGGASLVAEFAGKIFYAGFSGAVTDGDKNSPVMSSYVLFSQTIRNQEGYTNCYQSGDPTSREASELVDTDGGFFRVSGAKEILGLVPSSRHLIVIASNGVWAVTGGGDYGFSATNYSVEKISTFGCVSSQSIVNVNDQIYFLGQDGIYMVSKNPFGDWTVGNISEKTIQKYYNEISEANKEKAVGIYDISGKTVRWLFNQDTDQNTLNIVRELVIDVSLGSFTKTRFYNLASNSPQVIGFITTTSFVTGDGISEVQVGGVQVTAAGDGVIVATTTRTTGFSTIKYLTLYSTVGGNVGYTFSELNNDRFLDWEAANGVGVDALGYILTGTVTGGDSSIHKQSPYLTMHFRRTEVGVVTENGELVPDRQSSCLVRSQWDWADTIDSRKWSNSFQAYRYRRPLFITDSGDDYENGFEIVTTKNKLRGRGRALSLYFSTEPLKDCRIVGFNLQLTGNQL